MTHDVAIVGAGPAGLSAALILGRCRRDVVVLDSGVYRNASAREVRGFITREGTSPSELRRLAREELARYDSVALRDATVTDAHRDGGTWTIELAGGGRVEARALLLATGIADTQPDVPGARELHGRRVFPCPYCEGWELRDRPLAALSTPDDGGARFALTLARWTSDLVLCTSGPAAFSPELGARLAARGIVVEERPVVGLSERDDVLEIRFTDGAVLRRAAMFYHLGCSQGSDLATRLGAHQDRTGSVAVDRHEQTTVDGLWVAGDATRDALLSIVAAGEGACAGMSINTWLTAQDD